MTQDEHGNTGQVSVQKQQLLKLQHVSEERLRRSSQGQESTLQQETKMEVQFLATWVSPSSPFSIFGKGKMGLGQAGQQV
jgi:hypothetical protein